MTAEKKSETKSINKNTFPSINIQVNPKQKTVYLISGLFVFIVMLISLLNVNSIFTKPKMEVLGATDTVKEEIMFWEGFLKENPTYMTGWVELTKLEIERGNFDAARLYFDRAQTIDPNSEILEELKEELIY